MDLVSSPFNFDLKALNEINSAFLQCVEVEEWTIKLNCRKKIHNNNLKKTNCLWW